MNIGASCLPLAPFNGDSFLHAEVARLMGFWRVEVAFETGTHHGHTSIALSHLCPITHTVEINETYRNQACTLFDSIGSRGELLSHLGSSPEVLESILSELMDKRALFFLDAHWHEYWPLLDELAVTARLQAPLPVIVIHDCKVPGRPDLGYDSYAGVDLDLAYVQDGLSAIYHGQMSYHYNQMAHGASRGVLFVEPLL